MKDNVNSFIKKYGGFIVASGCLFGAYYLGTKTGYRLAESQVALGLDCIFKVNPDIRTSMVNAINQAINQLEK